MQSSRLPCALILVPQSHHNILLQTPQKKITICPNNDSIKENDISRYKFAIYTAKYTQYTKLKKLNIM